MLDYCPKQGKQNSKHKAHARRATRTRTPTATRKHTPQRHQPTRTTRPNVGHNTRLHAHIQPFCFPLVPVAGVEPARPTGRRILSALCLPISSDWHRKRPTVFYSGASAPGGTRTHTPQRIPDFESGVSTNSTTGTIHPASPGGRLGTMGTQ